MNEEHAKPGDTIKIIKSTCKLEGVEFLVVKCPEEYKDNPSSHCAWVEYLGMVCFFGRPESYEIVSQTSQHEGDDVDASLKEQLDANLRDLFV